MSFIRQQFKYVYTFLINALNLFLSWRVRHISNNNFLIMASIIVGLLAGLAAVTLKVAVHKVAELLQYDFKVQYQNYLFFVYPLIGILLTTFYVQRFRKGKLGRGIGNILYSIFKKSARVEKDKTYSHIVSSALTVGFGGSVGLEAPIVVTGSAIGSNTATALRLNYKERTLLLACGAAAGIAAIFNSPIAGVIFAMEVLLAEFAIPAFIPLLISSATATLISKTFYSGQLFFLITEGWQISSVPFYILLGLLAGLLSAYMTRTTLSVESFFKDKKRVYVKAISGGVVLGILIFFMPPLYGEGYGTIEQLLEGGYQRVLDNSLFYHLKDNDWFILLFLGLIIFIKVIATSITIGSGGNGGIFAPSLFTGALLGFFFAHFVKLIGLSELPASNFIVVGMAGILSGVIHAPLTGIFLIAEISGGYELFVPLMIVSASSYFIARYFEPYTVYTKPLAERGHLDTGDKDRAVLNQMKLKQVIEKDFLTVDINSTMGELIKTVAMSKRNIFPVVNREGRLMGIISLDDIREIMFDTEKYDSLLVKDIAHHPPVVIDLHDEMYDVMKKFEDYNAWNLPVIEYGRYVGFVSKSHIFTKYRHLLIEQSEGFSKVL